MSTSLKAHENRVFSFVTKVLNFEIFRLLFYTAVIGLDDIVSIVRKFFLKCSVRARSVKEAQSLFACLLVSLFVCF